MRIKHGFRNPFLERMDVAKDKDQILEVMGMMSCKGQRPEKYCAEDPPVFRPRRNVDGMK